MGIFILWLMDNFIQKLMMKVIVLEKY